MSDKIIVVFIGLALWFPSRFVELVSMSDSFASLSHFGSIFLAGMINMCKDKQTLNC